MHCALDEERGNCGPLPGLALHGQVGTHGLGARAHDPQANLVRLDTRRVKGPTMVVQPSYTYLHPRLHPWGGITPRKTMIHCSTGRELAKRRVYLRRTRN